jgi:hypothetical protein
MATKKRKPTFKFGAEEKKVAADATTLFTRAEHLDKTYDAISGEIDDLTDELGQIERERDSLYDEAFDELTYLGRMITERLYAEAEAKIAKLPTVNRAGDAMMYSIKRTGASTVLAGETVYYSIPTIVSVVKKGALKSAKELLQKAGYKVVKA